MGLLPQRRSHLGTALDAVAFRELHVRDDIVPQPRRLSNRQLTQDNSCNANRWPHPSAWASVATVGQYPARWLVSLLLAIAMTLPTAVASRVCLGVETPTDEPRVTSGTFRSPLDILGISTNGVTVSAARVALPLSIETRDDFASGGIRPPANQVMPPTVLDSILGYSVRRQEVRRDTAPVAPQTRPPDGDSGPGRPAIPGSNSDSNSGKTEPVIASGANRAETLPDPAETGGDRAVHDAGPAVAAGTEIAGDRSAGQDGSIGGQYPVTSLDPVTTVANDTGPGPAATEPVASRPQEPVSQKRSRITDALGPRRQGLAARPATSPDDARPVGPPPRVSRAVVGRAQALVLDGRKLAERGAVYAARAKFIQALRTVARSLDVQARTTYYSRALARGLQALDEAADFYPTGSQLEGQWDVERIAATHQTPLVRHRGSGDQERPRTTALGALQQYHAYAEQELADAGGNEPVAADALFGLAKLQPFLHSTADNRGALAGPRAMSLYQAALIVQPNHYLAANELGVLFARYGQYDDATTVLEQCVSVQPNMTDAWHNLAKVYELAGQPSRADVVRERMQIAQRQPVSVDRTDGPAPRKSLAKVDWVDNQTFLANSAAVTARSVDLSPKVAQPPQQTMPAPTQTAAVKNHKKRSLWSWWRRADENLPSQTDEPRSLAEREASRQLDSRDRT